jgi:hypothetical protein
MDDVEPFNKEVIMTKKVARKRARKNVNKTPKDEINENEQESQSVSYQDTSKTDDGQQSDITDSPEMEATADSNRGDDVKRRYRLDSNKKQEIKSRYDATGGTINPMESKRGAYWAQVEALIKLGPDEWHRLNDVRDMMQEIMSQIIKTKKIDGQQVQTNAWDDFYNKKQRSGASTPKDGLARIEHNMRVLQRLPKRSDSNPYGLKLAQFGMTIDIHYEEVEDGVKPIPHYRLNTQWDEDEYGHTVEPYYHYPRKKKRKNKQQTESSQHDQSEQEDSSETHDAKSGEAADQVSSEESHSKAEIGCESDQTEPEGSASETESSDYTNEYDESEISVDKQTLYIDFEHGSDSDDGFSPETALQSVEQLRQIASGYSNVEVRDPDDNLMAPDILYADDEWEMAGNAEDEGEVEDTEQGY